MSEYTRDSHGQFSETAELRNGGGPSLPEPFDVPGSTTSVLLTPGRPNHVSTPGPSAPSLPPSPDMKRGFDDLMRGAGGFASGGDVYIPEDNHPEALRARGYGPEEHAGDHQVITSQGPAWHGADIPGTGVPGPADQTTNIDGGSWQ
jgi:hypothetical protein